jgi:selenocysteine lyase/cysteine desulfurase
LVVSSEARLGHDLSALFSRQDVFMTQATATPIISNKPDFRESFYDFDDAVYLNLAGQAPIPRVSCKALEKAAEWKKLPQRIPEEMYFSLPKRVRELLAQLLSAAPEEFALTTGASGGLQAVAQGIAWRPEDEVLVTRGEFPAHLSTWAPLAQGGRLKLRVVAPSGRFLTTEDVVRAIGPQTRLVSISHVRFDDGSRIDPRPIADAVHTVGGFLLLDASQSAGAVPMRVRDTGADFLVASGYKWILSTYGTGFFWIRRELIEQMVRQPFYWMAHAAASDFNALTSAGGDHRPVAEHASRWDAAETTSFFNLAVMEASLEFVLRAGVETVWRHNTALIEQLFERLPVDRCIVSSPADQNLRGPYGCFAARSPEKTQAIYQQLREAKIFTSLRGNAIRVAPYLYNSERDIDRLIGLISG